MINGSPNDVFPFSRDNYRKSREARTFVLEVIGEHRANHKHPLVNLNDRNLLLFSAPTISSALPLTIQKSIYIMKIIK